MKTRLTKRSLDRLTFNPNGPSTQVVWDETQEGFGVRLHPSGKKTFVCQYRTTSGTQRIGALGPTNVLTVEQALKRAIQMRASALGGEDPLGDRRASKAAPTVRAFAKVFIEDHAQKRKTGGEMERRLNRWILPAIGSRKLAEVKPADIRRLHARISKHAPYEANRIAALTSSLFQRAIDWGHLPDGHANPAARVKHNKEKSRERWILPDELPALFESIEKEENPYVRAALKLALFTGARRSELLRLRWPNVNLARAEVRLLDTKNGKERVTPLVGTAVEILRNLPRLAGDDRVFPPTVRGRNLDLQEPWTRVRERAELADLRFHDVRRSVGSWLASAGVGLPVIGEVLGHTEASSTMIYAKIASRTAREALETHEKLVNAVLEAEKKRA